MGIFRTNDPTQFDDIDGIIIDEQTPPSQITGLAANVGILIGQFQRGSAEMSLPLASIGEFQELYGKSSYSGNKQLKNKAFGRLKIIRAIASDAALATLSHDSKLQFDALSKGAYGNNISVTIEDSSDDVSAIPGVAQVETFDFSGLADGGDLDIDTDGRKLNLASGLGYLWFNVTDHANGPQTDPGGTGTGVQVDILDADTPTQMAQKSVLALDAAGITGIGTPTSAVAVMSVNYDVGAQSSSGDGGDVPSLVFAVTTPGVDAVAGTEGGVKLTIKDKNPNAILPTEVYDNLKIAEIIPATFAASKLVKVTVLSSTAEPALLAETNLASGSDGTIADTDYEAAMVKAEVERAGNVLFLDEYNSTRNLMLKTHAGLTQDKMVITASGENDDRAAAIAEGANLKDADGRIIHAWPYVETLIEGAREYTSPAAWVASIFTQVSPHIALSYTANTKFLGGITDLKFKTGRNGHIALDEGGVLAFEQDGDIGFVIKNAIVTQRINTQKREILRRRMADFLQDSIALALKNWQNGVNANEQRDEVNAAILDFDTRLVRDKIVPGAQDVKSGAPILVDTESLNTDSSVALGLFKILYKRRIFSSMRYIVLQAEIGTGVVVTEV